MSAAVDRLEARVRELEAALRTYAPTECGTGGLEGCGCVGCRVSAVLANGRPAPLTGASPSQMQCPECGSSAVHYAGKTDVLCRDCGHRQRVVA